MLVKELDIYNCVPNSQNEVPPYTQMYGSRESLSHLRIFWKQRLSQFTAIVKIEWPSRYSLPSIYLVGYSCGRLLSYKIYMQKLNLLIITADVTLQEYDEHGKSYEQIFDGKKLKFESKTRDLFLSI